MMAAAPFLHPLERGTMDAVKRYLDQAGVHDDAYAVIPGEETPPAAARVVIRYVPPEGRGYARAVLGFTLPGGPAEVTLTLHEGLMFLCMLLAHGWLDRAGALAPGRSRDDMLADLGIDRWRYWRMDVRATQEGRHIGADAGGYAYYAVDVHGEVEVLARSPSLPATALRLAAAIDAEKIDLAGRIGALRSD